ncbi:MAG: phosphoglucosamine mutase [Holosporales bacterium]|nr:phosphoglucosamine mutase [Holosporales bacterium]
MKNLFGTDGIRGKANAGFITPLNAMRIATAVVNYYRSISHKTNNPRFTVVIGKDTRLSGYMLEPSLTAGFVAAGANVTLLGPIPTPGVAFMTKSLRADLGVVISASHNQYQDNGIKFFNSEGLKLSLQDEAKITSIFNEDQRLVTPRYMGRAKRLDDAAGRYVEFVKNSFPKSLSLSGMKIIIDTAHGAAYKVAPQIFWELGASIIAIGNSPNGLNINHACGAMHVESLQKAVVKHKADIGIALDGDADRVILVDETGDVIDGDYLIAAIAKDWQESGKLARNVVVATTMSNLGLEKYLHGLGIALLRTDVGDKYVLDGLLQEKTNVGGEKSGHIILTEYSMTGDGTVAALQVLAYIQKNNLKASSIKKLYTSHPQILKNVRKPINIADIETINCIKEVETILGTAGRLVIRKSGTEPITRIMLEAESRELISIAEKHLNRISG